MPEKTFVNYRRDDARDMAARIRDRLADAFGDINVFMDVDNLLAGQRFDKELEKALDQTDVFLAVIGRRWLELLVERQASGERDYVREEVAGALQRGIVVIPVLIERTLLPRAEALPEDIRDLVLHQKHVVTHEQFGRDVAGLVEAIRFGGDRRNGEGGDRGGVVLRIAAITLAALVLIVGGMLVYRMGAPDRGYDMRTEADLLRPGGVFRDCADVCPEMVVVPAGSFLMGSSPADLEALLKPPLGFEEFVARLPLGEQFRLGEEFRGEVPQHRVTITRPFAVGKYEVTFAEWDACVAAGGCQHRPSDEGWGRGRRPVINVSWHDAKEYAAWLSRRTGKSYRLLSEAEWEYAARAGTTTPYAFGDTISKSQAQYSEATHGNPVKTVEVGSFPSNRFGLHDLHGNAWEWVEDSWHPNYRGAPIDGSVWSGGDTQWRVLRGGAGLSWPTSLRSAYRHRQLPEHRYYSVAGFRLARTI